MPILISLLISSCAYSPHQEEYKDPWPNGVMYEIFVQSFADSDVDGIGDIPGMTSKLDYLSNLGVEGVWLMPINPSPSYHKYDVTDYYGIHPDYGTLEDFQKFINEAHKRHIRVIMDLVVNHTSSQHPWFRKAVASDTSSYRDYYVWADPDSIRNQIAKKKNTLDSDNMTQWHQAPGKKDYYYGFFYRGMPDLNYDNPEVRKEIIKIGQYWLNMGVDGFRLDAAKHIFPDERAQDTHLWWQEFGDSMRKVNPEVYLVGEVWGDATLIAPYLKGLSSMFNFDFYHHMDDLMKSEKDNGIIEDLIETQKKYEQVNPDYIDAIFLNNHDQNRLLSNVGGNVSKARVAASLLLTLPGMPYLYYGDEIGMLGKKPDPEIREPFLWDYDSKAKEQTKWIEGKNSNDNTVVPLAKQIHDPSSLFSNYKSLIHLRNDNQTLQKGNLEPLPLDSALVAYSRGYNGDTLIVINNVSSRSIRVGTPADCRCEPLFLTNDSIGLSDDILTLPALSSVVIRK